MLYSLATAYSSKNLLSNAPIITFRKFAYHISQGDQIILQ